MDILEIIEKDHDEINRMAKEIEEAIENTGSKSKEKMFNDLKNFVSAHMEAEEEIFYPPIKEEDKKAFYEAVEEHDLLRHEADLLEKMTTIEEQWAARFKVIKDLNDHHIEEEETNVFKIAKKAIPKEKREEMGRRFEDVRSKKAGGKSSAKSSSR